MSAFHIEIDDGFSIKNFTLNKFFKEFVEECRKGSIDKASTPLGTSYHWNLGTVYFDESFLKNPSSADLSKKEIGDLYRDVIAGDNVILFDDLDEARGKIVVESGDGDDIIDFDDAELTAKSKKLVVDAGAGDDIIVCSIDRDERHSSKKQDVIFEGGKGRDIFYGVPSRLVGVVKDFDVKKDYLGFDENSRRFRLHETADGVAVVDRRSPDGMLLLKGVDSVDEINFLMRIGNQLPHQEQGNAGRGSWVAGHGSWVVGRGSWVSRNCLECSPLRLSSKKPRHC